MHKFVKGLAFAAALVISAPGLAQSTKPTVVLVHGAFADGSSWNGVVERLEGDGYPVVTVANPLRSVSGDADYVRRIVSSINGPVVLVGHSYGGSVISEAASNATNVRALVYVAAFAPDKGETANGLTGKYPGSTLPTALGTPVSLADGDKDLYILQAKFHHQFAADVPEGEAKLMAAAQRPITDAALGEASTEPAWTTIPSWFVYGDQDLNIPPQVQAFMAERAHSKQTVVVKGASHVVMVSHPAIVTKLIETAAQAK